MGNAIHPFYPTLMVPGTVEGCLKNGIEINPWTVNDEQAMKQLKSVGCHALITNYPDVCRKVVDED